MPHGVERHCDVCVIGGSDAGLAAALGIARRGLSVIVVADGRPEGAEAEEVRRHGGEVIAGRVERVGRDAGGDFRVELSGGHSIVARRVLTAADLDAADTLQDGAGGFTNQIDWDRRYGRGQMWSGNPNGTLVAEIAGLAPGRALDIGAGEGGDAIWLAEQGWRVTASDISQQALHRIAAEAERRGLAIECRHADANGPDPYAGGVFDLVSAQYASIPRTPDDRAVRAILAAVAPGGTLLVVSHDLEPMRAAADPEHGSRPFDPDAYVRVEDVAAALAGAPEWAIEVHERRPRPPGAATASHHVDDVVLRARRAS